MFSTDIYALPHFERERGHDCRTKIHTELIHTRWMAQCAALALTTTTMTPMVAIQKGQYFIFAQVINQPGIYVFPNQTNPYIHNVLWARQFFS